MRSPPTASRPFGWVRAKSTSGNAFGGASSVIQIFAGSNGALDDLRIYGRALNQVEIQSLTNE